MMYSKFHVPHMCSQLQHCTKTADTKNYQEKQVEDYTFKIRKIFKYNSVKSAF